MCFIREWKLDWHKDMLRRHCHSKLPMGKSCVPEIQRVESITIELQRLWWQRNDTQLLWRSELRHVASWMTMILDWCPCRWCKHWWKHNHRCHQPSPAWSVSGELDRRKISWISLCLLRQIAKSLSWRTPLNKRLTYYCTLNTFAIIVTRFDKYNSSSLSY